VHNCEVDSLLSTARRAGVPITDAEADRYVEEQVVAAVLVGAEEADVPRTVAELAAYFDGIRARLAITPAARSASRFILLPPMPGWVQLLTPARPAWSTLASLGAATLPRWARQLYGLPGFGLTDAAATAGLKAFRQTALAVPARMRESPIVRAARARVAPAEPLSA
jgi:uncharacterized protein (DUF2236 family)